ncbi:MAG: hypothetical protein NTX49_08605 [Chlamydiae bacterium]|nr:hypothetical protein [Chlamydiota bacterium]
MRSKYLALGLVALLASGFSLPEFTEFYDTYVQEIAVKLGAPSPEIPAHDLIDPEANAVALFNEQKFTLWLSPVSSEQSDLATYYQTILTFAKKHNIKKVIWYFGYTSASAAFYDPTSTDPTSFVKLLTTPSTTFPSTTQIELRIECASMSPSPLYTGATPEPTAPTHSVLPNYMNTSNGCFYNCLWWARDLYNVVKLTYPSLISGVTVDSQNNCLFMDPPPDPPPPDYGPYTVNANGTSAAINAQQAIVNYLDEFASINSDFYPLKRGMTFDGSARKQIFGNRATLPIADSALVGDTSLIYDTSYGLSMYFYNGSGSDRTTPWTRPNPSAPFLDYIYPQLYNLETPYVFTLQNQPLPAGMKFLQLLSNSPYCPGLTTGGALSTISYTEGSKIILGSGTQFETELNSSGLNSSSPIAVINSSGQQCLVPSSDPGTACAAKISITPGVTSDVELSLGANVAIPTASSYLPWLYVENEINYLGYAVTPEMVSGIFLMFSAEGNTDEAFFGYWTLSQFMNFINSFYTSGQTSDSPYRGNSGSISIPNEFAIFTYEQITGKAGTPPAIVWFPGE